MSYKSTKWMKGTEGGADYHVLVVTKRMVLGVKPLVEGTGLLAFGFRVRLAHMTDEMENKLTAEDREIANKKSGGITSIKEGVGLLFPGISWQKVSNDRASGVTGQGLNLKAIDPLDAVEYVETKCIPAYAEIIHKMTTLNFNPVHHLVGKDYIEKLLFEAWEAHKKEAKLGVADKKDNFDVNNLFSDKAKYGKLGPEGDSDDKQGPEAG